MATVHYFPEGGLSMGYFYVILLTKVAGSMASTVQFVGVSAFVTQIADPVIGGTYMTLLNTLSNFGGTWPVYFVMRAVDYFTRATCELPAGKGGDAFSCAAQDARTRCETEGGTCTVHWDGYYIVSTSCILVALTLFVTFIRPAVHRLERLPAHMWRVSKDYSK
ncbi:hypothetical protein H4R19_003937 [Coemansia spiralis]|nr:hypothetical protein H4R19_003937 [Coemansia spiralis]